MEANMANHGVTGFYDSYNLHSLKDFERASASKLLHDNVLVIPLPTINARISNDTITVYAEFADGSGISHTLRVQELIRALTIGGGDLDYWVERVAHDTLRAMANERLIRIIRNALSEFLRKQKR